MAGKRIIQIIPAVGWRAMLAVKPEAGGDNLPYYLTDLTCFALVDEDIEEEELYRHVIGLTSSDIPAYIDEIEISNSNFIAYIGPNADPKLWIGACLEHLEKQAVKK